MGERIRSFEWSQTPIGGPTIWSPALHTTINILLANSFPMLFWWGPNYISIYNDAYRLDGYGIAAFGDSVQSNIAAAGNPHARIRGTRRLYHEIEQIATRNGPFRRLLGGYVFRLRRSLRRKISGALSVTETFSHIANLQRIGLPHCLSPGKLEADAV